MHGAEDPHEHEDHEGCVAGHLHTLLINLRRETLTCCLHACPKKNGVEVCKLIYGLSGPYSGTMVRHRDDDS